MPPRWNPRSTLKSATDINDIATVVDSRIASPTQEENRFVGTY
jgi:hypothetical protein